MKITIIGEFPTLNEIIKASKAHYMAYSTQKKKYTNQTILNVKGMPKINFKANYTFTWHRKTRRSDPDNIQVGTKYIFDGMIKAGLIKNDGWNEVASITHKFEVDKDNPRVEIEVEKCTTA